MGHHHHHHGGFGHHHHGFGHHHHHRHHHHGFGHHGFRHHHAFGPEPAMVAAGALAAGAMAGVLAGSAMAKPSVRQPVERPPQNPGVVHVIPQVAMAPQVITPPPQMPLGVLSIRIPPEAMERRGNIQFFAVEVFPDNGQAPWRVLRRYNQFYDLGEQLGFENVPAPFPRKHLTGCDGMKLQSRRQALEFWLSRAIACGNFQHWIPSLRAFLEVPGIAVAELPSSAPLAAASATSQALAAQTVPTNPPAAAQSPPAAREPLDESVAWDPVGGQTGMLMEIEIPSGVIAGQLISVTVPSGQQVVLKIPEGVVSGQSLQLWHDPEQSSLEPLL